MRYIVDYTYGPGSYGSRVFDIDDAASPEAIRIAARLTIPNTATEILDVRRNDGSPLIEEVTT